MAVAGEEHGEFHDRPRKRRISASPGPLPSVPSVSGNDVFFHIGKKAYVVSHFLWELFPGSSLSRNSLWR